MDELEKLRKHWQDDDFQRKHALAREIVVNRLRELNRVSYKKGVPPEMERRIEKYARIGRRLDKLIQKTLDDSKTV